MRMTNDQERGVPRAVPHEQCAGCAAMLVADQRYCLRCGARRGQPRLDFTAFWRPLSPTGPPPEQGDTQNTGRPRVAGDGARLNRRASSRRLAGVLGAFVLATGIVAGAAIGQTPPNSPADASTLAQRALAALAARADSSPVSAPTESTTTSGENKAATTSTPVHKVKAPTPHQASTPASSQSESPSESSSPTPSSENTPSEGAPSKSSGKGKKAAPATPIKLPQVKHVWLIALSGESFSAALKDSAADPYLAKQLVPKGTLLSNFTLSASSELGNGIALLSGQGVNLDTEQNCPSYAELQPPTINATNGLAEGVGCVYPTAVKTLADELTAGGLTWKAYVQNMQPGAPSATSTTPDSTSNVSTQPTAGGASCRHPVLGAPDANHTALAGDPYLTFRNPFVYFDSLLSSGACTSDDVDLSQLQGDLATPATTPSLSWIVPSACDDGASAPCAPGAAAGLGAADALLKEVVGQILTSAAYREAGLIAIVPDSAPSSPTSSATTPVGALLLSPFVRSGASVSEGFNDFSLLKSLTRLFGVLPLGHANDPSVASFGAGVYRTTKK